MKENQIDERPTKKKNVFDKKNRKGKGLHPSCDLHAIDADPKYVIVLCILGLKILKPKAKLHFTGTDY